MSSPDALVHSIRVGVFSSLVPAQNAVSKLIEAGFSPEEITVVCSGEAQQNYFRQFRSTSDDNEAHGEVSRGAAIGATVGGVSAVALGVVTGVVPLVVAGIAGAAGGSPMGGFLGIMTSKEVKDDFLNSCHEQVLAGKILVAAEDHGKTRDAKLARAAEIFMEERSEMNSLQQA